MPLRRLLAVTVVAACLAVLGACGGPPTPSVAGINPVAEQPADPEPGTTTTPGPGETAAPTASVAPAPTSTATPNPGAPPPAGSPLTPPVPAELLGTWHGPLAGSTMTKAFRADATYTESWADPAAPCQAEGTLQVAGATLTLIPRITTCPWGPVAFHFTVTAATLTLTSGTIDQDYTRA